MNLYLVTVQSRILRNSTEVVPEVGHFEFVEAKNEAHLLDIIWDMRREYASSFGEPDGAYVCTNCYAEHYDETDYCETCGYEYVEFEEYEDLEDEFVEDNSDFEYVEYDPDDPAHVRIPGYPETREGYAEWKAKREAMLEEERVSAISDEIVVKMAQISALLDEINILEDQL